MARGAKGLFDQQGGWQSVTQQHSIKDKKIPVFRAALRGEEWGEKGKSQRLGVGGNLCCWRSNSTLAHRIRFLYVHSQRKVGKE